MDTTKKKQKTTTDKNAHPENNDDDDDERDAGNVSSINSTMEKKVGCPFWDGYRDILKSAEMDLEIINSATTTAIINNNHNNNQSIGRLVEQRRYKCTYGAPYSPFLNSIEQLWSKVKLNKYGTWSALLSLILNVINMIGVQRSKLSENNLLILKIIEAVKRVAEDDCVG
ncbi:hypothetical protein INT45_007625 [Circinella minor]|uniref:Tc1-like transposase DDE domain-containing protein n=1 Tax=Circinella minor TaxID=1195481 RepID=A0A8H7RYI1_9FUNG|nr:hypothetical protein INT45_007625 [Circinella minor]